MVTQHSRWLQISYLDTGGYTVSIVYYSTVWRWDKRCVQLKHHPNHYLDGSRMQSRNWKRRFVMAKCQNNMTNHNTQQSWHFFRCLVLLYVHGIFSITLCSNLTVRFEHAGSDWTNIDGTGCIYSRELIWVLYSAKQWDWHFRNI